MIILCYRWTNQGSKRWICPKLVKRHSVIKAQIVWNQRWNSFLESCLSWTAGWGAREPWVEGGEGPFGLGGRKPFPSKGKKQEQLQESDAGAAKHGVHWGLWRRTGGKGQRSWNLPCGRSRVPGNRLLASQLATASQWGAHRAHAPDTRTKAAGSFVDSLCFLFWKNFWRPTWKSTKTRTWLSKGSENRWGTGAEVFCKNCPPAAKPVIDKKGVKRPPDQCLLAQRIEGL